jgi:transposase InsO family protein
MEEVPNGAEQSIYAIDFVTVDTIVGRRFYVLAVISHTTREIVRFAITENPTREFVRQQLMLLSEAVAGKAHLIHDNALMFDIDYLAYNLVSVTTGVEAPNMNSIMERFFGTLVCRKKTLNRNVFINIRPMNTDSSPDQTPVLSLHIVCITQPGKPFQRCGYFSPICKYNLESI